MERNCNSCNKQAGCKKFLTMSEDERNELSCTKHKFMPPEQNIGLQQEKSRNYMISLAGVERYFV